MKTKTNLSKLQDVIFYQYLYPIYAREFLIDCANYEDFAELINTDFILSPEQWENVLNEWKLKESILKL